MNAVAPGIRQGVDLVAVALLLTVPIIGFGPTFDGPGYLVTGFGALVLGLAIAWAGARWRWGALELAGSGVAAYFLFGGALALPTTTIAGVIPTLDTWRDLALGVVTSWKALLTTVPPVATGDGHLIVPLLLSLTAAIVTGSLALRVLPAVWALVPAVAFLGAQILFGMTTPAQPLIQGILFAVVATVWLALRAAWDPERSAVRVEGGSSSSLPRTRRLVAGAAVVAVAAGAGVATAAFAEPPTDRYVLRDYVVPPFDVRDYPSPLQSFRGYVRDFESDALFTVAGLPDDARIRLAAMDAYDGVVYNVSEAGAGASSAFAPARSNMSPDARGDEVELSVQIEGLTGVWLPGAAAVREIVFDGPRADDLRRGAHYNDATGTAVVTAGVAEGDAYTLRAVLPDVPSDAALAEVEFAPVKMPPQDNLPGDLAELASKAVADAETPIDRVRALTAWLSSEGYFSHGLADDVRSPSGHGAARISALLSGDQMVGDDEQYAVAMALMAGQLGIPARVVMGWHPGDDGSGLSDGVFTATGDNLHAWVEVAFDGLGWVPFDPTPDEDNEPNEQTTTPRANPRPQVLQPPPPPQEPAELPPTIANDREQEDDDEAGADWLGPVLVYSGIGLGVILLILAPFLIIGAIKAMRRRRRREAERTADRLTGGWDELVDTAVDLRVPVAAGVTRAEMAAQVTDAFDEPAVTVLAGRADAGVYGPGEPSDAEVEAFWREVDDIVGGMKGSTSVWARLRARLSLRSLRRSRGSRSAP